MDETEKVCVGAADVKPEINNSICAICLDQPSLPVRLSCSHTFCFVCAKGLYLTDKRCALCRSIISDDFSHPDIAAIGAGIDCKRREVPLDSSAGCTEHNKRKRFNSDHVANSSEPDVTSRNGICWPVEPIPSCGTSRESNERRRDDTGAQGVPPGNCVASVSDQVQLVVVKSEVTTGDCYPKSPEQDSTALDIQPGGTASQLSTETNLTNSNETEQYDQSFCWYYRGRKGWWKYDARSNDQLEQAYVAMPNGSLDLLIVGSIYRVDFARLVQFQRDNPSRQRRIKRDRHDAAAIGIAGVELPNQDAD